MPKGQSKHAPINDGAPVNECLENQDTCSAALRSRNGHNSSGSRKQPYLTTDPNFVPFRNRLKNMGLELRDIVGDGNCLFRALSDQLDGNDRSHLKHREEVVEYIRKHELDFAPFVEDDIPFMQHINELQKAGTYAGNDAIVAFAKLHEVNVIIHQLDAPSIEIKGNYDVNARQLHISYHNGDHYSSVRRLNDSTNKPVNIRISSSPAPSITQAPSIKTGKAVSSKGMSHPTSEVSMVTFISLNI